MKRLNLPVLCIILLVSFTSFSQERDQVKTKTLLQNHKPFQKMKYLGLYLAPEIQYTQLAGSFAPMYGGSAMILLNRRWAVGAAAYSTFDNFSPTKLSSTKAYNFESQYGGLKLEYTPKPEGVVHVSFPLLIGAASAKADSANEYAKSSKMNHNDKGQEFDNHKDYEDQVWGIIQPGINLETNVFRFGKVFLGANYRLALGKNALPETGAPAINTNYLNGVSINAGLKIGLFDFDLKKNSRNK